jgi:hypothetical protein
MKKESSGMLRSADLVRTNVFVFVFLRSVLRLLVMANVSSSLILVILMMEALNSRNFGSYNSDTA